MIASQSLWNGPTALVVGAGFAGAVSARILADAGWSVFLKEKRSHIGGNAYDRLDENGILIHPYGPHLFHTNSRKVLEFLSRFTNWRFYEHRVLARVGDLYVPMPINRTTLNLLYDLDLSPLQAEEFLAAARVSVSPIRTSEDAVLSSVGHDLCDKLYRGYTRKQWGRDLSEILAGVAARIPVRTNDDDRYFEDVYQFMPSHGYTALFEKMLDHPSIEVELAAEVSARPDALGYDHVVFTGPVDEFFGHCLGRLQYRSLEFEHLHFDSPDLLQRVATVNYPNLHEYTRTTEFRHITGQSASGTSIVREYPRASGEPYYPIPNERNQELHGKYRELTEQLADVTFVGRLAQYRYYNMDQVVAAALAAMQRLLSSD